MMNHAREPEFTSDMQQHSATVDVLVNGPYELQRYGANIESDSSIGTGKPEHYFYAPYICMYVVGNEVGEVLEKHALLIIQLCLANPFVKYCIGVLKLVPCLEDHPRTLLFVRSRIPPCPNQTVPPHPTGR